jgi:TonB family protein
LHQPEGNGTLAARSLFAGHEEEGQFHLEVAPRSHPQDDGRLIAAGESQPMSAGTAPALAPKFATTRKVPRYKLAVPAALTVLRSGVPDSIPGHTHEIGEGGLGVVVASQLLLGEAVRVEFLLPHMTTPVRATAVVRYQHESRFGLQFLRLSDEQQSTIRYWTRREADVLLVAPKPHSAPPSVTSSADTAEDAAPHPALFSGFENYGNTNSSFSFRRVLVFGTATLVIVTLLGWWRWQQGWTELEAQVPAKEGVVAKPQLQVPAETMQQRITHKVMPEYPENARRAGLQGTVVLDAVVNADGTVTQLKVVSGPEALSLAAMDAVRWWRYQPYLVNGQPATVETTVSVEFRLAN